MGEKGFCYQIAESVLSILADRREGKGEKGTIRCTKGGKDCRFFTPSKGVLHASRFLSGRKVQPFSGTLAGRERNGHRCWMKRGVLIFGINTNPPVGEVKKANRYQFVRTEEEKGS